MEINPIKMKLNYLLLIIISALVYGSTLSNGYNYDDELVTLNNPSTSANSNGSIIDIFSSSYHEEYGYSYGYRPITTLSFYIEHRLFKESAKVSHLINLFLYLGSILLLYNLLSKVFSKFNPHILLFICLLFAVHTIHSEAIASIKNRDEILAFLFLEIAIFSSLHFMKKQRLLTLLYVFLAVSLSLLSKKSGVSILLLIPFLFHLRFQLSFARFLFFATSFVLPISLFLFNLNVQKGILIFTLSLLAYALVYYLSAQRFFSVIRDEKPWYFFIPLFFSFLFFTLAFSFEEVILWAVGCGSLLFYTRYRLNMSVLSVVVMATIGYFIFHNNWFLLLNLFILSTLPVIDSLSNRNKVAALISLLAVLLLFVKQKGDWVYGLIYLIPLILFFTSKINKILPLIITGLSFLSALLFFKIGVFHIGLFLGGILLLYKDKDIFKELLKRGLLAWTILMMVVLGYSHFKTNGSLLQTLEQKQELAELLVEKSSASLQEGRKLEYMENTLVAPHTLEQRIATGFLVLGEYFRLMIFPKELSFYYGYSKIQTVDFSHFKVWISLLIHLSLLLLMVFAYQKQPLVSFGILWYFTAILLFSNWPVLVAGMVGERLGFIASVGFCVAIGGVLNWIKPNFNLKKPKVIELVTLSILVLLSVRTIARNDLWESPAVLMQNDIGHLENSAQANYMLAMSLVSDVIENSNPSQASFNRLNSAITYFEKAIEIYPYFFNYHFDLGRTHVLMENYRAAKSAFLEAHRLEPDAIISLDELVKTSFDLEAYEDVIQYGKRYLSQSKSSEVIYELVAYSAFLIRDFELSTTIIKEGLMYHPNNQNLNGLLLDVNNEKQSNGN